MRLGALFLLYNQMVYVPSDSIDNLAPDFLPPGALEQLLTPVVHVGDALVLIDDEDALRESVQQIPVELVHELRGVLRHRQRRVIYPRAFDEHGRGFRMLACERLVELLPPGHDRVGLQGAAQDLHTPLAVGLIEVVAAGARRRVGEGLRVQRLGQVARLGARRGLCFRVGLFHHLND